MQFRKIAFTSCPFWIQFHGIPLAFLSKTNLEKVGAMVGKVIALKFDAARDRWKSFIKCQVEVSVETPLFPRFYLPTT